MTGKKTGSLTDNLTIDKTDDLTIGKTDSLTIYNIKEEKNKDKISFNNIGVEKKLSLDELEKSFLADVAWQSSILSLLSHSMTHEGLKKQIGNFFNQLRCQGMNEREEEPYLQEIGLSKTGRK